MLLQLFSEAFLALALHLSLAMESRVLRFMLWSLVGVATLARAQNSSGTGQLLRYTETRRPIDGSYAAISKNPDKDATSDALDYVLGGDSAKKEDAVDADSSTSAESENLDSYYVELVQPQESLVTSFALDLRNNLLPNDLFTRIESDYRKRLWDYQMNSGYYQTARDRRGARPYGMTIDQERQLSADLAGETRDYMLKVGLPNFLRTRQATKHFGENYNQAMRKAQQVSSLSVKTEQGWRFNSGFDPFHITINTRYKMPFRMRFFANASNGKWMMEFRGDLKNDGDPYQVVVGRRYRGYNFEVVQHLYTQYYEVKMGHSF